MIFNKLTKRLGLNKIAAKGKSKYAGILKEVCDEVVDSVKCIVCIWILFMGFFATYAIIWTWLGLPIAQWSSIGMVILSVVSLVLFCRCVCTAGTDISKEAREALSNDVGVIAETGEWQLTKQKDKNRDGWWFVYTCSNCGYSTKGPDKVCPSCKRQMTKGDENA